MSLVNRCLMILLALTTLFSLTALAGCTPIPVTSKDYDKAIVIARNAIWQDITSGKAGSATVAIMVDGNIVYSEGIGMADREKGLPVTTTTLFNIGSITKVFTATAIMLLVDDGKVKLDDPVVKYLPDFTMADPRYKDITVRMTLNHSSGLPGTTGQNNFGFEYNNNFFKQTLESLSRAHLMHAPGEMAPYQNDGFTLAEMIVERVSGKRFTDFLKERALNPLGMRKTGLSVGQRPGEAMAYFYEPGTTKRQPPEAVTLIGAGGFAGTAEDLCRFQDMFSGSGKQIFTAASLAEMKKVQPSGFYTKLKGSQISYGLGWDFASLPVYETRGLQVLGKSGGTQNYSSMMFNVPAQRVAVAVIEAGNGNAIQIAQDILGAVLEAKGLLKSEMKSVVKPPEPQPIPAQYATYEGYYSPLERIAFDLKADKASVYSISAGAETPSGTLTYNNGYFYDENGGKRYFASVDGRDYVVNVIPSWGVDSVSAEKLKKLDQPKKLSIDLDGTIWLMRNALPSENINFTAAHVMPASTVPGLPGYIDFLGPKVVLSPEFAGIPVGNLRDQTELTLVNKDGQTWARLSEMLFSSEAAAAPLGVGSKTVSISTDGYSQWLRSNTGLVLSFEKPEKGRVIVFAAGGGPFWDSATASGEIYVPKGSFIELLGSAGATFNVTAR
jgi:CubicO group peptidase (beta-lactamase class C family)